MGAEKANAPKSVSNAGKHLETPPLRNAMVGIARDASAAAWHSANLRRTKTKRDAPTCFTCAIPGRLPCDSVLQGSLRKRSARELRRSPTCKPVSLEVTNHGRTYPANRHKGREEATWRWLHGDQRHATPLSRTVGERQKNTEPVVKKLFSKPTSQCHGCKVPKWEASVAGLTVLLVMSFQFPGRTLKDSSPQTSNGQSR